MNFDPYSTDPIERVASQINKRRYKRADMLDRNLDPASQQAARIKHQGLTTKAPSGWTPPKEWKLVGVVTPQQDAEFTRAFGDDYFEDGEFFAKAFPQLSTRKPWDK